MLYLSTKNVLFSESKHMKCYCVKKRIPVSPY